MSISQIIQGTVNNLMGLEEELCKARLAICSNCPLYVDSIIGKRCDNTTFLNPKTGEISKKAKSGFFKGCGCVMQSKARLKNVKCPLGKW